MVILYTGRGVWTDASCMRAAIAGGVVPCCSVAASLRRRLTIPQVWGAALPPPASSPGVVGANAGQPWGTRSLSASARRPIILVDESATPQYAGAGVRAAGAYVRACR